MPRTLLVVLVAMCVLPSGCLDQQFRMVMWNDDVELVMGRFDVRFDGDSNRSLYKGDFALRPGEEFKLEHARRVCDENGFLHVELVLANQTEVRRQHEYFDAGCGPQNVWVHLTPDEVTVDFAFVD